jgi:ketosteroid isomerase-like protein
MVRAIVSILFALAFAASANAADLTQDDRNAVQAVISAQIEAFRKDDGPRAYGFAAPVIQQIFPSVADFMAMVRNGYKPVYRPQSFRFGVAEVDGLGRTVQHVVIVGPDGKTYEALYTMERQPDGTWKIAGCVLVALPGLDA